MPQQSGIRTNSHLARRTPCCDLRLQRQQLAAPKDTHPAIALLTIEFVATRHVECMRGLVPIACARTDILWSRMRLTSASVRAPSGGTRFQSRRRVIASLVLEKGSASVGCGSISPSDSRYEPARTIAGTPSCTARPWIPED